LQTILSCHIGQYNVLGCISTAQIWHHATSSQKVVSVLSCHGNVVCCIVHFRRNLIRALSDDFFSKLSMNHKTLKDRHMLTIQQKYLLETLRHLWSCIRSYLSRVRIQMYDSVRLWWKSHSQVLRTLRWRFSRPSIACFAMI